MALPTNRADTIERLRYSLRGYAPRPSVDARLFADFTLAVARTADLGWLTRTETGELFTMLDETLAFAHQRQEGEVLVRVVPGAGAVLESSMRDQPFLYDTLRLLLDQEGVATVGGFHGVVPVGRDEEGVLVAAGQKGLPLESIIHLELDGELSPERADALAAKVRERLQYVRGAVRDFPKMVVAVEQLLHRMDVEVRRRPDAALSMAESRRFLAWLLEQHFIFMGCGYIPAGKAVPPPYAEGLGGLRLEPFEPEPFEGALAENAYGPQLSVRKVQAESRIHRRSRLDHVLVRWFDEKGVPGGLVVFEGLFTYRALARPTAEIPLLEPILTRLIEESGLPRDSYRARVLRYAFSVLPVDFLFTASFEDVSAVVERITAAADGRTTELAYVQLPHHEAAYVFVATPKAEYDDELRESVERVLAERLGAPVVEHGVSLAMQETAVFHFRLVSAALRTPELEPLHAEVLQLVTPWSERLRAALEKRYSPSDAERLVSRYHDAFHEGYRRTTSPARSVLDIGHLEALAQGKVMSFDLFREEMGDLAGSTVLRIYEREDVILSDLLPVLEHFGLLISSQYETKCYLSGGREYAMDSFILSGVRGLQGADVLAARERLLEAVDAVFSDRFTDSPLNALMLRTDVSWRDVGLIRSYLSYARQLGFRFTPQLVQDVLLANADMVRQLARIFRLKFDPRLFTVADARAASLAHAREQFLARLREVADYAADSILRSLLNLIDATLRTNLYCRAEMTDNLALKFDVSQLELLQGQGQQPQFEIFVHHASVHGVHLRGGKVARGGLRWSDRIDDYRTEVLGLMRTQQIKNAIIVPVGAKGGFVLQKPAENPKERRAQADACYRVFVSALLDVTDNIVDGRVVRPADVIAYDEPDPYLVVAADKGTAHLSDVANGLSAERGFWLADAFASGGSNGYDHKATGITARGAWVCTRRHLRELGVDPDKDTMTVVGIGDMSGDVFGNGLLCSPLFKLLGAFDHRHIFLDPDPDPARSFAERARLFKLPGSSWADYDRGLISKGGGVFPRGAKEIPLSPELKARLGIGDDAPSGEAMIRALLTLDVDLLWNGGIGTYIKAATEDARDAGDRANDSVRVDGKDVRARIIGEGGNLGVTQAGRLEYAARGGRLNNDAFDNSGGVDLSDHEVNLKILFAPIVKAGRLSLQERNTLLAAAQGEVCDSVLSNNQSQSRLISLDQKRSRKEPMRFARAITFLARVSPFERKSLRLPDERTLRARAQEGEGVYRPELALLSGWTKIYVKRELLREAVLEPRSPRLWPLLHGYFPRAIGDAYRNEIAEHLLAREIGFTQLTNLLVGDAGISFFPELQEWSGRTTSEVAAAYLAASEAAGAWSAKEELAGLEALRPPQDLAYPALLRLEEALEQGAALLLAGLGGATLETPTGARQLLEGVPANLPVEARPRYDQAVSELAALGVPDALARRIAGCELLGPALLAAGVAERTGRPAAQAFAGFFSASDATRLLELERRVSALPAEGRADAGALRTLRLRFLSLLARVAGDEKSLAQAPAIGVEVQRALGEDLSLAALVTLEDRVQRLVGA